MYPGDSAIATLHYGILKVQKYKNTKKGVEKRYLSRSTPYYIYRYIIYKYKLFTGNKSTVVLAAHYLNDRFVGNGTRVQMTLRCDASQTYLSTVVFTTNEHFSRFYK